MDLTVEIDGNIGTLEEALAQFTASEILDGENKYKCSRCKSYEKAKKKLSVLEAPNILTIVLKRFQSCNLGKLNKLVQFPEVLNLAPYMSGTGDRSSMYSLYAVVVHLDIMNAAFSGHYVCYIKNFQGEWFRIDDSTVIPVDLQRVLFEGAYMLLYARHTPRFPSLGRNTVVSPDGKVRRNLEAVPSRYSGKRRNSKARSNSMISSMDSSMAHKKPGEFPYWMTSEHSTSNQLLDPEDWRLYSMQRNPIVDSSSDSSPFSCSDAGSYSTESTKDSSSAEDLSGYIFGVEPGWYSPYGLSLDSDASWSSMYSRPALSGLSSSETWGHQNFNVDSEEETGAFWGRRSPQGSGGTQNLRRKEKFPLYTSIAKYCKKMTTRFGGSSSRGTDLNSD